MLLVAQGDPRSFVTPRHSLATLPVSAVAQFKFLCTNTNLKLVVCLVPSTPSSCQARPPLDQAVSSVGLTRPPLSANDLLHLEGSIERVQWSTGLGSRY